MIHIQDAGSVPFKRGPFAINAPHFRHILAGALEGYGKAPLSLDVTKAATGLVLVTWDMGRGIEAMTLSEQRVIDEGGPDWVARLILMGRHKRREELRG